MVDVLASMLVFVMLIATLALRVSRYERPLRSLVWLAFGEYMVSAGAQIVYGQTSGGDAFSYGRIGATLAQFLDRSFASAFPELVQMLLQHPSRFDALVPTSGSNTGSMYAAAAFLVFIFRSADYAVPILISGLSFFSGLATFDALREMGGRTSPRAFFLWTVMFPSVAFWTSALLKEAFCVIGIGTLLTAYRYANRGRWLRAVVLMALGVPIILLFRAPALPPLVLGLGVYFVANRLKRTRGSDALLVGPVYMGVALAAVLAGVALVGTVVPSLNPSVLAETMVKHQQGWSIVRGGSAIDEPDAPASPAAMLWRLPLGLLNALFRPQLFDVTSALVLVSAAEMTAVTWVLLRSIRRRGRAILDQISRSPFLLMCVVIVFVGCAFVGLVTLNFGSLARYRVPFFPFYGAILATLSDSARKVARSTSPVMSKAPA